MTKLTKKEQESLIQFEKEIEELIEKRRKANNYATNIKQDKVFNHDSQNILYKYIKSIENKEEFHCVLRTWITMMEDSNEVEEYIINGMDGVLGALWLYTATGAQLVSLQ